MVGDFVLVCDVVFVVIGFEYGDVWGDVGEVGCFEIYCVCE